MFEMTSERFLSSLIGLPHFALYLVVALAILAFFLLAYIAITPHDELALIRDGNVSAALALSGAMIGFVLPLSKSVAQAGNIIDVLVWGFAAFIVQLLVFRVVRVFLPDLSARIQSGNVAAGIVIGGAALACGLLNAAAMSM